MSETDVRRQALREIAREKAKKQGKAPSEPYLEEDKGRQWQQTKEVQEEGMPFKQASPEKIVLEQRSGDDSAFSWTQFAPWKKAKQKKKPKTMNTATIWCMARREIAQEWRMAKGIKKRDSRLDQLEREAAMWEERQEEKRLKAEEARVRFEKQRVKLEEALKIIGQKILDEKENLTPNGAVNVIEDAMGAIGKVYCVDWRDEGCDIWIEPWEERWPRQKTGESLPIIYRIKINSELEMSSYDLVEDEEVRLKIKEELEEFQLEELDEEPRGADEKDIKDALEKRVAEMGRLVELKKWKENCWIVIVEPWEEMRIRNIERKGEGPIETDSILAKVVDGTIITSPIKGNESWEKKATEGSPANSGKESESELGAAQQKEGGKDAS